MLRVLVMCVFIFLSILTYEMHQRVSLFSILIFGLFKPPFLFNVSAECEYILSLEGLES
jgi:hypothetical protein